MKNYLLLIIFLVVVFKAYPQEDQQENQPKMCRTSEQMKQLYHDHPDASREAMEFEEFTRKMTSAENSRAQAVSYTIPVVFHVFGTDFAGQTVNDNTIITALEKVNEDFQGLNDDYNTVSQQFSGIKSPMDITFKLAKLDPSGNATTGINYHPVRSGFGNGSGYDAQIQQFAWDNYKYMNVYIMLDLYANNDYFNSGVAWYPNTWMSDNNLARVVYNGRYLYGNTNKEFASVLTHEFGHWLNLAHTFDNGCSAPGDNVSDTPATLSNSGSCNTTTERCPRAGIANGENYMDYSTCYKMYTAGQVARMTAALDHPARQPTWQESNLVATGVNSPDQPRLLFSASSLMEDDVNEGAIEGSISITANNGAAFATIGNLTEGVHYTTTNVPPGLSLAITVLNSTNATLSFNGNAVDHANTNDVSTLSISFLNAAIQGGISSIQNPTYSGFSLDFKDPYTIVYSDINDLTVNSSNPWEYFTLGYGNGEFGCWFHEGNLRFETYQKALVSQGTSRNITRIAANQPIGPSSNWVLGGAFPDEHNLRTPSYTAWDGKPGFIGFRFTDPAGKLIHGWFRVAVNADGTSYTLFDYAYYTKPQGTLLAGATSLPTTPQPPTAAFTTNTTNIGTGEPVTFTDASTEGPTSWLWAFQGGTPASSTAQNPTVTYSNTGTYDVTLEVSNANGSNALTKTGYITVTGATPPAYCSASGGNPAGQYISSVEIGSIQNATSYESAGYSDYTTLSTSISGSATLTVTPHTKWAGTQAKAWVDWNRDGDFTDSGEEVFSALGTGNYSTTVTVPAGASPGNVTLRVRTAYGESPTPCGSIYFSEAEDYTLTLSTGATGQPASTWGQDITIFPNPSPGDQFHFLHPPYPGDMEVEVYNLTGILVFRQVLAERKYEGLATIPLGQKLRGTYLVHIKTPATAVTKRIIFE